jgi:hypothetical protein
MEEVQKPSNSVEYWLHIRYSSGKQELVTKFVVENLKRKCRNTQASIMKSMLDIYDGGGVYFIQLAYDTVRK